jgi:phage gpG-like protein
MVKRLDAFARSRTLLDSVAALVQQQTVRRIRSEKSDPDGRAWRPWSPSYAATRGPGHSLLIDTQLLVSTFAREVRADGASVYTTVPYAAPNQTARPFLGFGSASISEVETHVIDELATAISRIAATPRAA